MNKTKSIFGAARNYNSFVKSYSYALLVFAALWHVESVSSEDDVVSFNEHIRPILSDKCFHCHGPDEADRKAGLRLDTEDGLSTDLGGYMAIVPGDPLNSEVFRRITHNNPEDRMPPAKSHKDLTSAEIDLIKRWIIQGATYENHWAFEPIRDFIPPKVSESTWSRSAIDRFVYARMLANGLSPSEEAEKHTLLRRVTLDLTGLPPTQEQLQAFMNDVTEDAYEKLVDRLLASPAFGQHLASTWLDAARYADTHGFHFDNHRSIWPYRDWVVQSFNQNMPFDEFSISQLAGDLRSNPTQGDLVATGFLRSNPTTNEGGAIEEEYRAIYAEDRTNTMSTVWMGLTTGCASCHDHKFDPISQKEFYQLTAFFRNTTELAMDQNAHDAAPSIFVLSDEDFDEQQENKKKQVKILEDFYSLVESVKDDPEFESWAMNAEKSQLPIIAKDQLILHIPANEGANDDILEGQINGKSFEAKIRGKFEWMQTNLDANSASLAINESTLIELPKFGAYNYGDNITTSFWVKAPDTSFTQPILSRFDLDANWWGKHTEGWYLTLSDDAVKFGINARESDYFEAEATIELEKGVWNQITLVYDGTAGQTAPTLFLNGKSEPFTRIHTVNPELFAEVPENSYDAMPVVGFDTDPFDGKKKLNNANALASPMVQIRDLRVYEGDLSQPEIKLITALGPNQVKLSGGLEQSNPQEVFDAASYYVSQLVTAGKRLILRDRALVRSERDITSRSPVTLVMQEKVESAPEANILLRGQYNAPGDKVGSAVPAIFPQQEPSNGKYLNRLDLAQWLFHEDHPLTSRVTVNRFWSSIFGRGLVETVGDFGSQAIPPSHPQLLDWLANDFKNNGWNVKRLFKQMVMSATYRQSARISSEHEKLDPRNIFLARSPRFRLNAEVVRDQALSISGLLDHTVGGPGVKPYQPAGLWRAVAFVGSNTEKFVQDKGSALYRRSLYTYRKRTSSPPGMALFDAPTRETCSVQRERSNTPMQALMLMNDPQFVEAARVTAQNLILSDVDDKLHKMVEKILGRTPNGNMMEVLQNSYTELNQIFKADEAIAAEQLISVGEASVPEGIDKNELATWTMLVSSLFNSDEFLTKN